MLENSSLQGCFGHDCNWTVTGTGSAACVLGEGTCSDAKLLTAVASDFHDQLLINLTKQINQLLAAVPSDPSGRKLSFLHTRRGPFLAWVHHDVSPVDVAGGVTAQDDDATIAQALRLL